MGPRSLAVLPLIFASSIALASCSAEPVGDEEEGEPTASGARSEEVLGRPRWRRKHGGGWTCECRAASGEPAGAPVAGALALGIAAAVFRRRRGRGDGPSA